MLTLTDVLHNLLKKQLQVHLRHMLFLELGNNLTPESAAKIRLNYADTGGIEFRTTPCLHDIFVAQFSSILAKASQALLCWAAAAAAAARQQQQQRRQRRQQRRRR